VADGRRWGRLAVLAAFIWAAGCGRVGYEALQAVSPVPEVDAGGETALPSPPDAASPVDEAPAPVDTAAPADSGPTPTPAPDMALPIDAAADAPAACTLAPAADLIADFEAGTLNTNRVGSRGGPAFHMVDPTVGTVANVALSFCGQRVMQLQPIGTPGRAALVQAFLMPPDASGNAQWFDARVYRGVALNIRSSAPTAVRLKMPNRDTFSGGNDHFQVSITVGTGTSGVSFAWGAFKQTMAGSSTQFPTFDVSRLGAVEISASLPAGASLWVDEIAFVR
jgi:hypothetical protein